MIRTLAWLALLPGALLLAWGIALVATADQDTEGVRGMFGWIFLVGGLAISGTATWAIARRRRP